MGVCCQLLQVWGSGALVRPPDEGDHTCTSTRASMASMADIVMCVARGAAVQVWCR